MYTNSFPHYLFREHSGQNTRERLSFQKPTSDSNLIIFATAWLGPGSGARADFLASEPCGHVSAYPVSGCPIPHWQFNVQPLDWQHNILYNKYGKTLHRGL